jgi:flagellar hook-associated protein 3 FlgL
MRIATSQLYQQSLRAMAERQAEVSKVQQQLSRGHRLLSPQDDPVASSRLLELHQQIAVTEQYQRNITLATGRLSVEESALQSAEEVLQRARELAVRGHNAALSGSDRKSMAQEVRQLSSQLLTWANTQEGNGEYLFAGFKVRGQPFVLASAGEVAYQGDQGQRQVAIGPSRQVAVGDSGAEVFQLIRNGNGSFSVAAETANTGSGTLAIGSVTDPAAFQAHTYRIEFTSADTFDVLDEDSGATMLANQTYGDGQAIQFAGLQTAISGIPASGDRFTIQPAVHQDLFTTLEKLATALEAPAATPAQGAQRDQSMANSLADLDQGLDHVLAVRAQVGTRLNALQDQDQANQDFTLHLDKILADIDGLNYAEAAVRLQEELTVLQATQQSFLRLQDLSLFNYLR